LSRLAHNRTAEGCAHVPPCWHDGTERSIHRPKDPEEQQDHDSGQKKCHTVKHLLMIDETCHMCFLSDICEGKAHDDKSLADLAGYTLPYGSCLYPVVSRILACQDAPHQAI
jgi:radical SAM protein with 4Fe4S-binding SPASM domain